MSSPTLSFLDPGTLTTGQTADVTVHGSDFLVGVVLSFSSSVTVNSITFIDSTSFTANVTVGSDLGVDVHSGDPLVTVTNTDAGFITGSFGYMAITTAPYVFVDPVITGSLVVGSVLTNDGGFWFGTATLVTTYQWWNSSVGDITGATSATYTTQDSDVGFTVGCQVTVTNDLGTGGESISYGVVTVAGPTISSLAPDTVNQDSNSGVDEAPYMTIFGTGFVTGATVAVSGAGVTVTGVFFNSSTSYTFGLTVAVDADMTARDVTLTNPDDSTVTGTGALTVIGPRSTPTITSVSPTSMAQGTTGDVTLFGTGFIDGAFADIDDAFTLGINTNSNTFVSSTEMTVNITIPDDATLGVTDAALYNTDGGNADLPACFTVTAAVAGLSVTSVSPTSLAQGATGDITITGVSFVSGAVASFSGSGITVNSTTFGSSTSLTANITIAGGAATTVRSVTVTNPDTTTATAVAVFTVSSSGGGGGGGLAITSTSPASQTQGDSANVTIHGSGFVSGAVVSFSGSGVTVSSTTFTNSTQIVAFVVISGSAALGTRGLTVTNPDSTTATVTFTIEAGGGGGGGGSGVAITSLNPASFDQGTSGSFAVTGTGFVSGITGAFAGDNITINSLVFNSSTSLTINVTVVADAGVSENDLTLTNPDSTGATGSIATTIPSAFSMSAWRWVLSDTTVPESYTMEINPNAGGSLPLQKNVTIYQLTADDGEMVLYEGSDAPQVVQASGTLLTEAQYNHMVYWYSKRRPIQLTDDLGRTLWVYFTVWTPTRKWSVQYPWRHDWSASFYVVGQQAVNAL